MSLRFKALFASVVLTIMPVFAAAQTRDSGGGNYTASDFKEVGLASLDRLLNNKIQKVGPITLASLRAKCAVAKVQQAKGPLFDRNGRPADFLNTPSLNLIEYKPEALAAANLRQLEKIMIHECLGLINVVEDSYEFSTPIVQKSEHLAEAELDRLGVQVPDPKTQEEAVTRILLGFLKGDFTCRMADRCSVPAINEIQYARRAALALRDYRDYLVKETKPHMLKIVELMRSVRAALNEDPARPFATPNLDKGIIELQQDAQTKSEAYVDRMGEVARILDVLERKLVNLGTSGGLRLKAKEGEDFVSLWNGLDRLITHLENEDYYSLPTHFGFLVGSVDELINSERILMNALTRDLVRVVEFGEGCPESNNRAFNHISMYSGYLNPLGWSSSRPRVLQPMSESGKSEGSLKLPEDLYILKAMVHGTSSVQRPLQLKCESVRKLPYEGEYARYNPADHSISVFTKMIKYRDGTVEPIIGTSSQLNIGEILRAALAR
jgi:hypothetical protein